MPPQQKHSVVRNFNFTARVLHWLMAVLILAMLFIGVGMMSSLTLRPWLIDLHRPLGIAILLLAILRLGNRLLSATPPLPASVPYWQAMAAHVSHLLLYMLMLSLPLLGWATLSAGNWPVTMIPGWNLPPIAPVSSVLYAWFRAAHGLFAWLLFLLVIAHLCAALMHAWVYRDGVFSSITRKASGK
ncbi:Cytochrome b561 homolog 2 [Pseudomonas sp. Bi70]|uniref:cytochrome b n=1 Tax=Pseudomonas sp. Bi70 TaxID=2821127 RepID=UPI001DEF7922|nr:cytochrome b/b6 domain-containing protein [Pseudomonas sp. Bi70]CAH0144413.1 Cytochrome b561 homolog 2 [Pseudomonas sp. Bi70]